MLALIRILLLAGFVVLTTVAGLLLCLVRPFHRENVGVVSAWYGKASRLLGVTVEIRRHPAVHAAMPCVFLANHQNNYDLFTISGALLIGFGGTVLMNYLWPINALFARWDLTLMLFLLAITLASSYLVTLYPALRASFGALNQQLKE